MPVSTPPLGGPLGRSRSRLSASALTSFLRCDRQWFLGNKVGIRGPLNPSQVLGIVLEDALCSILMQRPVGIDSIEELKQWASSFIEDSVATVLSEGGKMWHEGVWRVDESWDDVDVDRVRRRINGGLELFFEEVEACYTANGGPYLELFRSGQQPFNVAAPSWGDEPVFPIPDKIPSLNIRKWSNGIDADWKEQGSPVSWSEAWEIARPWVKDPRVHQPQRMFHKDGWAAGELDLVLRWDGRIRLVDVKSGDPTSKFAASLQHQLGFYSWLWFETHESQRVDGMEGWYLDGPHRVEFEAPSIENLQTMTGVFKQVHEKMQAMGAGPAKMPVSLEEACDGESAGCHWCSLALDGDLMVNDELLKTIYDGQEIIMSTPSEKLQQIPQRVSVTGKFTGAWGPLPNHFGEPVLGAMLMAGMKQITIEESQPGAFPELHDCPKGDIVIIDALPGVWRGQARLYVDVNTRILSRQDAEQEFDDLSQKLTRVGLLRTRANVEGIILCIAKRSGKRLDGKPWAMLSMHLWDGEHVVEVAAFGSSITGAMEETRPGDTLKMTGAEIGWRNGLPQLRIDIRSTRLSFKRKESLLEG